MKTATHSLSLCVPQCMSFANQSAKFKDVLMGIPKRDLLGMTVAVIQTVGNAVPILVAIELTVVK